MRHQIERGKWRPDARLASWLDSRRVLKYAAETGPKHGLAVRDSAGVKRYPNAWHVGIDPKAADLLIPHEYGHTLMFSLLPDDVPSHPRTLPHTTSARIFLEVFHYTPIFEDAQAFYRRLHADWHLMNRDAVLAELDRRRPRMDRAAESIAAEPARIVNREVPELWVVNEKTRPSLPVFGMVDRPVVFDIKTAPLEFLMSVPGVGLKEAQGAGSSLSELSSEGRAAFEPARRAFLEQSK